MKIFKIMGLILLALFNFSCEDVINIKLNDPEAVLVIEGNVINNTSTQTVKVSKTVSISDSSKFKAVSGAQVTITDSDNKVFILREQLQYPGIYVTANLRGKPLQTYSLKVISGGKEYTGASVMPMPVSLDSLGISTVYFRDEKRQLIEALYKDPPLVPNYYRFVLSLNNVRLKGIYTYSDVFNDGKGVTAELGDLDLEIKSNDVVRVEMQCIDKQTYRYFEGIYQNKNRGGASTTPANPVSNISNGALGYFSAHTVQLGTVKLN